MSRVAAGNLSTRQAAQETGARWRLVKQWVTDGVLRPSVVAHKQGGAHVWNDADVRQLRRMETVRKQIASAMLPNGAFRVDWRELASVISRAGRTHLIVLGPRGVRLVARRESIQQALRRTGQPALVLESAPQ